MKLLITILFLWFTLPQDDFRKELKEVNEITLESGKTTVVIDNIFGQVEVKRGNSDRVAYKINKLYQGDTQPLLDQALSEVQLKVLQRNDSVIFYVDAPFICSRWEGCRNRGFCMNFDDDYSFKFDYLLEIPATANLDVRTVNDGKVIIDGIEGVVRASNVNGDVSVKGALTVSKAGTVNGDVEVYFREAPNADGRFETINGTISLYCDTKLNATVNAKTMHGALYSAFDYEQIGPQLVKQTSRDGEMTQYRLEETFGIEIGKNGPRLTFETLNGDIYLRKL